MVRNEAPPNNRIHQCCTEAGIFFFLTTLDTGPGRPLSLELNGAHVLCALKTSPPRIDSSPNSESKGVSSGFLGGPRGPDRKGNTSAAAKGGTLRLWLSIQAPPKTETRNPDSGSKTRIPKALTPVRIRVCQEDLATGLPLSCGC